MATFAYGYDSGDRLANANLTEVAGTLTYTYRGFAATKGEEGSGRDFLPARTPAQLLAAS